jgi:uncharacterized protein YbbC (DUF1343 family)
MNFKFKLKINKAFLSFSAATLMMMQFQCRSQQETTALEILPGAYQFGDYLPLLKNKRIGLLVNHSSLVGNTHLLDTLLSLNIQVIKVFGPEHGFRGDAADGKIITNEVDSKTGIPIISLYGTKKKPSAEDLSDIDILVFDIQDVGVRFYTYSSTMHYAMEACAENEKPFIVLDRPNPHGSDTDGPMLEPEFRSFVGLNRIPLLHGLTPGEMARLITGEGWLEDSVQCVVTVIPVKNYHHQAYYSLPVAPSPNLPNDHAIAWYPTLALFEGTQISVARGTGFPFQAIGYPDSLFGEFSFTPVSIEGVSTNPPHLGAQCFGIDLRNVEPGAGLNLQYLLRCYQVFPDKENFFRPYFNLLAGTDELMQQIKSGMAESEIRESWRAELNQYKKMREKYLIYPEISHE